MGLFIETPYAPFEYLKLKEAEDKGLELWIKREDLSHPFISGNKWRKLKYHLLEAEQQNKNILVTYGGAYSNHLLATAAAGAKYGFQSYGFIRGDQVENTILRLCALFGMQLHFVSRESYKEKEKLFLEFFGSNPQAYEIPEGGGGLLGEMGVAEMMEKENSIHGSHKMEMENFDALFTSVGTGSTLLGILRGALAQKLSIQIHGIWVLKGMETMDRIFEKYALDTYTLHHRFHRGGYAKTDEELIQFIHKFASETGVLLDQVYEAKMMMGIITLIQENYFKPGSRILAIHHGGVMGLSGIL